MSGIMHRNETSRSKISPLTKSNHSEHIGETSEENLISGNEAP